MLKSVDDHGPLFYPISRCPDGGVVFADVFSHVDNPSATLLLCRPQALLPLNFPVVVNCSSFPLLKCIENKCAPLCGNVD
ncbi:hypothetical protein PoB_007421600 [Plakobranchus ocellatus]|uniref:Uncharacterized protein n=1 Tax=Plakobranchus ocellatus TaxID=259542 RepID=A0AAV4DUW5_9GAST|nr:hypothetical protein PoB_007421600 [Plakobranchus ocellatus]